jgi:hypothetical protein
MVHAVYSSSRLGKAVPIKTELPSPQIKLTYAAAAI